MRKGGKRLRYDDREKIEKLYNSGNYSVADIAIAVGVHRATIYNELKRGGGYDGYPYSADLAQKNLK